MVLPSPCRAVPVTPMSKKPRTFLFEYQYDGSKYLLEIPADSREEAEARLNVMPWAEYLGEGVMRIPARAGVFATFVCWVRNLLGS